MTTPSDRALAAANETGELGNWIGERIDGLEFPTDARNWLGAACLHISLTHHISIARLVQVGAPASAFALIRPQIESHLRGLWLIRIASDDEIESVKAGNNPPNSPKIARLLEENGVVDTDSLAKIADGIWPTLCDFAHTGIRVIAGHLRTATIEPSFSDQEIEDTLQVANIWATLAGLALFEMAGMDELAKELGERGVMIAKKGQKTD